MIKQIARQSVSAAALVAVIANTQVSEAQTQTPTHTLCGPRQQIATLLSRSHGETQLSIGLAANGSMLEVFSSSEGISWSLVMTAPSGRSCLIATGENWISLTPVSGQVS